VQFLPGNGSLQPEAIGAAVEATRSLKPSKERTVIAYWLLVGIGTVARQRYQPAMWCSSNRQKECSVFTIGRIMIDQMQLTAAVSFAAAAGAVLETAEKWG
jgi:hypothetical protein